MQLPSGEKEMILDYMMTFQDRNPNAKHIEGVELSDEDLKKLIPQNLNDANMDYECSLADVIVYLKRCGYPLENCFIAFYSPVFSSYINCGLDPLPNSIKITKEDLKFQNNQYTF